MNFAWGVVNRSTVYSSTLFFKEINSDGSLHVQESPFILTAATGTLSPPDSVFPLHELAFQLWLWVEHSCLAHFWRFLWLKHSSQCTSHTHFGKLHIVCICQSLKILWQNSVPAWSTMLDWPLLGIATKEIFLQNENNLCQYQYQTMKNWHSSKKKWWKNFLNWQGKKNYWMTFLCSHTHTHTHMLIKRYQHVYASTLMVWFQTVSTFS